jgi:nicotinate-nucleotide adenylyltransferase
VRIGIFGGSFDPVHLGHLIVAEAAADTLSLDEVRFVPTARQPLKDAESQSPVEHRLAMLSAAIDGNPRFRIDAIEVERGGTSYTIDTLCTLRDTFPQDELFFLIGADAARTLASWREVERLPEFATIVSFTREGAQAPPHPVIARSIRVPAIGISGTDIRRSVAAGRSIRYVVPDSVRSYIATHRLYHEV